MPKLKPKHYRYIHCVSKKEATWCLIITLANVDRFSKFFHQLTREKIIHVYTQRLPSHLQYVATLPCEVRKSKTLLILTAPSTNCRHVPEDTFNTWFKIEQTVSRLLTLTDSITFWSLSDDISNQQWNVVALRWLFHNDYLRTVFVLSTLYSMFCTHIQVKSLVQYFCGRLHKIAQ